jgi:8-oxo-dGTP pyrophosphatase MutT (NUDIX family)
VNALPSYARAAVILLSGGRIALIERHRNGQYYFSIPGGHVEPGEDPAEAARREALEELGLTVTVGRLVIRAEGAHVTRFYYLAEVTGGVFGSGVGEEIVNPRPEKGTFQPVWLPIENLPETLVMPPEIGSLLVRYLAEGWSKETIVVPI